MDFFALVSWVLVIVASVTVIWPANILLMALAYRVRLGTHSIGMEPGEFWLRCTLGALGLCFLSLVMVGLTWGLVAGAQVPAGPVQISLLMIYLAVAAGFLVWIFALEDMLQAISLLALYIALPALPLLLLGRLTGFWATLRHSLPWLLLSSEGGSA